MHVNPSVTPLQVPPFLHVLLAQPRDINLNKKQNKLLLSLWGIFNPYTPKGVGWCNPFVVFPLYVFPGFLFTKRLQIADPTYLRHILAHLSFGFSCTLPSGGTKMEGS